MRSTAAAVGDAGDRRAIEFHIAGIAMAHLMSHELFTSLTRLAQERSRLLVQEASLWAELGEILACTSLPMVLARPLEASNPPPDVLLRVGQAADLLCVSASTLNKWRVVGGGPEFLKLGRRILYRRDTLEKFISSKAKPHTSAYSVDMAKPPNRRRAHVPKV